MATTDAVAPVAAPATDIEPSSTDTIQLGEYIVIQRQKYTKLHRFGNVDSCAQLGKDQIELRSLVGQPYGSTFRMVASSESGGKRGRNGTGGNAKRMQLERCDAETAIASVADELLGQTTASGPDNRHILDNGRSQALNAGEIERLRSECSSATEIVGQIVENSATFRSKTEYAQQKYVRKKEKKYYEYVQIRRPNIRLICDVMFRQAAEKIMGVRMDTLSQIVSYAGVCGAGDHMLYDSGTNGLLPAALLNSMGAGTGARLVHLHPGNCAQMQAVDAMGFPAEQRRRCISVNFYSVLRQHFQALRDESSEAVGEKRKCAEALDGDAEPELKVAKLDESVAVDGPARIPPRQQWMLENARACELFRSKLHSLTIVAKEHPLEVVKALLPFVGPSRPLVVFSASREVLAGLYVTLKSGGEVTNLRITSNWLRMYQILPNRTHPDVSMSGSGGFLLTGVTVK